MIWDILTIQEKNEVLLRVLVHVSAVDGHISPEEFTYLIHICNNLNIDPEKIRSLLISDKPINEILPDTEEGRMGFLYHALFIMNADNLVEKSEEITLYKLAFKLGFSESMTREFIELMKQHTNDDLPMDEMLNIIRKHNN
ncbi:MAG: TerB family tellurite resistance protein [Saprospiraceae bacterium]|nr:MAG: Tellurite resistance protein TerB [Bacteroidetes bacterium OLB9]MCO6463898.1 TerB family tellurite resistance protein [Saprospiraceae bacterium]MCZ2336980.1 TerB family tellurite resistance protein [Chitinophagales bacterium]